MNAEELREQFDEMMKNTTDEELIAEFSELGLTPIDNSIFMLFPKRGFGIWAFDDADRNLRQEPFVGDTNRLIDDMVLEAGGNPIDGLHIALLFSANPFPDHHCELNLTETKPSGSTYYSEKYNRYPWLCPAFYKYFDAAPEQLYGKVEL